MKHATRTWIISIVIFFLIIAILMLPIPHPFTYTFHGIRVDDSGSVVAEGEILFSGTEYKYLFRENIVRLGTLSLPGLELPPLESDMYRSTKLYSGYECYAFSIYSVDVSRYVNANVYLESNGDHCLVQVGAWVFVGSAQEDSVLTELYNSMKDMLN